MEPLNNQVITQDGEVLYVGYDPTIIQWESGGKYKNFKMFINFDIGPKFLSESAIVHGIS